MLDLAAAEFEELGKDLSRSGRTLGSGLGLAGAVIFIGFWAIGLLIASIAAILAVWLPLWQSLLIVLALVCLVGLILGSMALRRLRSLKAPTGMIRERWEDHLDWWQTVRGALGDRPIEIEPDPGRRHDTEIGADSESET